MAMEAANRPPVTRRRERDEETPALRSGLGVPAIIFMVVAAAAPLGVVAASTPVMLLVGGTVTLPLYYGIAGAVLAVFAVGYVAMSAHVPHAGAFYAYVEAGLGRLAGVGAATLALSSYTLLLAATYAYLGVVGRNLVADYLSADTPWWVWSFVALAVTAFVGYRNIEVGAKVLSVLLVAEIVVILVLDVAIVVAGGETGLESAPFDPSLIDGSTLGLGVVFAALGFFGFEATAVFRDEARDPRRTIPRATYLAVALIAVFYVVSSWAVVVASGSANALDAASGDPSRYVLAIGDAYVGGFFSHVMQVLLATSVLACALAFHNVIARYQYSLGRSGVLPRWFGAAHGTHQAPSRSSLVVTASGVAMVGIVMVTGMDPLLDGYTWFAGAAGLGIFTLMALTSVAILAFFVRTNHDRRRWNTRVAPALALLGLATVLVYNIKNLPLLAGGDGPALVIGVAIPAFFLVGVVIGWVLRRRERR